MLWVKKNVSGIRFVCVPTNNQDAVNNFIIRLLHCLDKLIHAEAIKVSPAHNKHLQVPNHIIYFPQHQC